MIINVKGTSFYQPAIKRALESSPDVCVLVPNTDNPHDEFAMRVEMAAELVGFLPKGWQHLEWARDVIRLIKEGEGVCKANIVGGFPMIGPWVGGVPEVINALYGVRVFIPSHSQTPTPKVGPVPS